MWIIRSSDLRAVVLVKGRGVLTVAIPDRLSSDEVLELASLVLSTSEYDEFRHAVAPHLQASPAGSPLRAVVAAHPYHVSPVSAKPHIRPSAARSGR